MSRDVSVRVGLFAAIALCLLALGGPAYAANHTVSMAGTAFTPGTLTVHVGDTVTWVHDGTVTPHSVTADHGSFDSSPNCPPTCLGAGATYSHTFTQAGTFAYHCRIHGAAGGIGMAGTIVVLPAATTTTTAPAPAPTTTVAPGAVTTTPAIAIGTPTTKPAVAAAGSGTTRAVTATATTPAAPTLARTGADLRRDAMVGALLVIVGVAARRARRSRSTR